MLIYDGTEVFSCSEFEQTTSARQRHDVGSVVKYIRRPETELLPILIRYDTTEEFNVDSKAEYTA